MYQNQHATKVHKIITKIQQKPPYLKEARVNLHSKNSRVLPYVRILVYSTV